MMKKRLTILLAIIIVVILAFVGCDAKEMDLDSLKDFKISIISGEKTFDFSKDNFKDFKLEDIKVTTNKKNVKKTFEYKGIKISSILDKAGIHLKDKKVKLDALDNYTKTLTFDEELINNTYIVLFEKVDGEFKALEKEKIKNVNVKDEFPNNWIMGLNKISVVKDVVVNDETSKVKDVEVNNDDISDFQLNFKNDNKTVAINKNNISKYGLKFKSFEVTVFKKGKEIKSTYYGINLKSIVDKISFELLNKKVKLEASDGYSKEIVLTEEFLADTYIVLFEEVDGNVTALANDKIKNVNINDTSMQNWVSGLNSIRSVEEVVYPEVSNFLITFSDGSNTLVLNNDNFSNYDIYQFETETNVSGETVQKTYAGIKLEIVKQDANILGTVTSIDFIAEDGFKRNVVIENNNLKEFYIAFYEKNGEEFVALATDKIKNIKSNDEMEFTWVKNLSQINFNIQS